MNSNHSVRVRHSGVSKAFMAALAGAQIGVSSVAFAQTVPNSPSPTTSGTTVVVPTLSELQRRGTAAADLFITAIRRGASRSDWNAFMAAYDESYQVESTTRQPINRLDEFKNAFRSQIDQATNPSNQSDISLLLDAYRLDQNPVNLSGTRNPAPLDIFEVVQRERDLRTVLATNIGNGVLTFASLKHTFGNNFVERVLLSCVEESANIAVQDVIQYLTRPVSLNRRYSRKDDFDALMQLFSLENSPSEAFNTAFNSALDHALSGAPYLRTVLDSFPRSDATILEKMERAQQVFDAVNNSENLAALRRETSPQFVNGLLGLHAAHQFQLYLSAPDLGNSVRARARSLAISESAGEAVATELANATQNNDFVEGFFQAFKANLGAYYRVIYESPELADLRNQPVRQGEQRPDPNAILVRASERRARDLVNQLIIPGAVRGDLNAAFGAGYVDLVNGYVQANLSRLEPAELTVQLLRTRLADIRSFLSSNHIDDQTINSRLDSWANRLSSQLLTPAELSAINAEMPDSESLAQVYQRISNLSDKLDGLLTGAHELHYTLGPRIWVLRMQTIIAQFQSMRIDPLLADFAVPLIAARHIDFQRLTELRTAVVNANAFVPTALLAIDQTFASGHSAAARQTQIATTFRGIRRNVQVMAETLAAVRGTAVTPAIVQEVERRFLIQFFVSSRTSTSPLDEFEAFYRRASSDGGYVEFAQTVLRTMVGEHLSRLTTQPATNPDDLARQNLRSQQANAASLLLQNAPVHLTWGIYEMAKRTFGGSGSVQAALGNTDNMARLCAMVEALDGVPPAYAAYLLERTGPYVLRTFDELTISVLYKSIAGYTLRYIGQSDNYAGLLAYYNEVPGKITNIFTNIYGLQQLFREQSGEGIRIRVVPDTFPIMQPSANVVLTIRVPIRVYEQLLAQGMLIISQSPRLTHSPASPSSMALISSRFFDELMINGRVYSPSIFLTMPLLTLSIPGIVAPTNLFPEGDLLSFTSDANINVTHVQTQTRSGTDSSTSSSSSVGVTANTGVVREGLTSTGQARYVASFGTGQQDRHEASFVLRNWRFNPGQGRGTHVDVVSANIQVTGDVVTTAGNVFAAIAPRGAQWFEWFQFYNNPDGTISANGQFFHINENGRGYQLLRTRTLSPGEAQSYYGRAFQGNTQVAMAAVQAGSQSSRSGVQIRGALLVGGLGAGTTEHDSLPFQGADTAIQGSEWGTGAGFENTRNGRADALVARTRPNRRDVLLLAASVIDIYRNGNESPRAYVTAAYTQYARGSNRNGEVRAFVGAPLDNPIPDEFGVAARANNLDILGVRSAGLTVGRSLVRSGDGTVLGNQAGASTYLNGITNMVALGVTLADVRSTSTPIAPGSRISVTNPNTSTTPGIGADARTIECQYNPMACVPNSGNTQRSQETYSAGMRLLRRYWGVEFGALYDAMIDQGAVFTGITYRPMGPLGSMSVILTFTARDGRELTVDGLTMNIISSRTRYIPELYGAMDLADPSSVQSYGAAGGTRIMTRGWDLSLRGGSLPGFSQGASGGLRFRLNQRTMVFGVGGYAVDDAIPRNSEIRTSYEVAFGAGRVHSSALPGFRSGMTTFLISGIYQSAQELAAAGVIVNGNAGQVDVLLGYTAASNRTTARLAGGLQLWHTEWPTEAATRAALTLTYDQQWRFWGPFANVFIGATVTAGVLDTTFMNGGTTSVNVNGSGRAGLTF